MQDFLAAAAQFINTTGSHLFLTGKAGTGKTTFLKNLPQLTHKNYIVVAPTGIAALNAGGVTIHSQFLLPPFTFLPDRNLSDSFTEGSRFINQNTLARKHPLNSARKQVLRSIDLLVIDEVSMLRADLLDAIDYRLRAARGNYRESFGGVQVLFIGDLYQLPPVVKNEEWKTLHNYYNTPWFYEAMALQGQPLVYIELEKIFRQHDPTFINILNNLRNNVATEADIEELNRHYRSAEEIRSLKEVITLTTHNYKADELNRQELKALPGESYFFETHVEGEFPESMYPVAASIELKVGAQIMFVRNDNESKAYFNGKLATVKEIKEESVWVTMADTNIRYQLRRIRWENKRYAVKEGSDLEDEVIGSFEQFPIKLAWAITVHKSQGLTFDRAIIDVGQAFADGQVYVALSRLRTLEGLILRTPIHSAAISTDQQIIAFARQHHKPDELPETMKSRQQEFVLFLFAQTFNFLAAIKDIQYLQKNEASDAFAEESMKPVLQQLVESLQAEDANTDRFRKQLIELLLARNFAFLRERLMKGSDYYKVFMSGILKKLLHHIEVTRQQKRTKTYLNQLLEIDQMLSKKLADIEKAIFLTDAILSGEEKIDLSVLNKQRMLERAKLLAEIRAELPSAVATIKGTKPKKDKKKKTDAGSTYDATLELLQKGLSLDQIAEQRGLVVGTIEGHLAKAVETGRITIFSFMSEASVMEIVNARRELSGEVTSKTVYDHLKGKYSYGQLRAVWAYTKSQESEESS